MKKLIKYGVTATLIFTTGCCIFSRHYQHIGVPTEHQHHHNGGDHNHEHTPHAGVIAPFMSDEMQTGFAELKLHDDKGDLELWLTTDKDGKQPFDLPLTSVIIVTFPELNNKWVQLRVRNSQTNEDEYGKANIRNGKTNYFIFPGETGADAKFLMGVDFATKATITFEAEGKIHNTKSFILSPHVH